MTGKGKNPPPDVCPYCDREIDHHFADHIRTCEDAS